MVNCPGCGSSNPEGYTFCSRCGATLVKMMDVRDDRLKESRSYVLRAIASRRSTDRIVSVYWILLMVMIIIVAGAVSFGIVIYYAFTSFPANIAMLAELILLLAGVFATIITAYVAYMLVKRQNDHFSRERALREGIVSLLRNASDPSGKSTLVMSEMNAMNSLNAEKEEFHDERIWALFMALPILTILFVSLSLFTPTVSGTTIVVIVIALPAVIALGIFQVIATFYMFYFLGKQISEHDERWLVFEANATSIMAKLRWPAITRTRRRKIETREFVIYLIISIFIPFFIYYWWYTLIKDPNEHFINQWEFEDGLANIIGK